MNSASAAEGVFNKSRMVGIVGSAEIEGNIGPNEENLSDIKCGIDQLADDVLVNILSRLSLKESARASVLSHRWRHLGPKILRFDHRDTSTGKELKKKMKTKKKVMNWEKFESMVNTVVDHYQDRCVEGVVISFETKQDQELDRFRINPTTYDSWVDFAMQKEVKSFELNLSLDNEYAFPSVERLKSHYHGVMSSPFYPLRALRLVHVRIEDDVIHYFLASCPNIEELCIQSSVATLNLRVMDPPRLRVLEISRCFRIQSVEISAVNLVSLTYEGNKNLVLKEIPNLRDLTICGKFCESFIIEPKQHWSYSVQLEKFVLDFRFRKSYEYEREIRENFNFSTNLPQLCSLKRLEVQAYTVGGRSLLFFASLVNACPQLCEFRIQLNHLMYSTTYLEDFIKEANSAHTKLKVVETSGYKGCSSEEELLLALFEISPSIESVVIDTDAHYHDHPQPRNNVSLGRPVSRGSRNHAIWCANHLELVDGIHWLRRAIRPLRSQEQGATTRNEAKKCARRLLSKFSQRIKSTIT